MSFHGIFRVTIFTISQAILSSLIAFFIGGICAYFVTKKDFLGKRILISFSAVPLCVPTLVIALGYVSFFGVSGSFNRILSGFFHIEVKNSALLYTFWGLVLAQGFLEFPIVMANVHELWKNLSEDEENAARILGASEARVFFSVTLPRLAPAFVSSMMIVFLYCFFSFLFVLLFGGIGKTTLEVEIYNSARSLNGAQKTAVLALIETFVAMTVLCVYSTFEQKKSVSRGISDTFIAEPKKIRSLGEVLFFLISMILVIFFFACPIAEIFVNAFKKPFHRIFLMKNFSGAFWSTVWTSALTSVFCVILGFVYAVILKILDPNGEKLFLRLIPMLPMAISGVVVGVIISRVLRLNTVFFLILAQAFLTWPLAFRQIYSRLQKLPEETECSAKILGKNQMDTIFRLYLPYCASAIFPAFGFCFAVSAGSTTLPLVMGIHGFDSLSLFTYRLCNTYRFTEGAQSALVLGILCSIVYLCSSLGLRGKK